VREHNNLISRKKKPKALPSFYPFARARARAPALEFLGTLLQEDEVEQVRVALSLARSRARARGCLLPFLFHLFFIYFSFIFHFPYFFPRVPPFSFFSQSNKRTAFPPWDERFFLSSRDSDLARGRGAGRR